MNWMNWLRSVLKKKCEGRTLDRLNRTKVY
jgi:hypothetical protein